MPRPKRDIQPANTGLQGEVEYSARHFDSNISENVTYLTGDAVVKYKNMTLEAGKITIFWNKYTMFAEGLPDSSHLNHSTDADTMAVQYTGLPVFTDGREKMRGFKMEYNFKSERGRVIRGRSAQQGAYYFGETIKRVAPEEFNIGNGSYTTCDKAEPHYQFKGKKMKIILGDKVIAKPVIFFIGKIPVAILPFAFYSTKAGRHSGIIIPQFGSSQLEGRYLRNLGYYWATNDYMDMRFTLDFFERSGVLFRTDMNYALRYKFRGSIGGSITRKSFPGGRSERRWDLRINHSQEINETTRLSVSASFVNNDNFYRDLSQNRQEVLRRQIVSNATLTKRWSEGKRSMTLNLSETRDLETGTHSRTLPNLQLSFSRSQIFPFTEDKRGSGRSRENAKWYNYLYYSYSGRFVNSISKASRDNANTVVNRNAKHRLNFTLSNPKKIFGWLSLTHSLNVNEDWVDRTRSFAFVDSTQTIAQTEDQGFAARHLFSYSTTANSKVYGQFNMHIGAIRAIRHVMTPSLSFTYQPNFSNDFWGYFQTVRDSSGNPVRDASGKVVKRDRFGGTPSVERNTLSFGLSNLFQMKLGEGERERKIDLFNLNFTGGYNFAADSLNWNNLNTAFRANPQNNVSLNINTRHSFYDFDRQTGRTVNKLLFNKGGLFNFLRLVSFRFDARWTLKGRRKSEGESESGARSRTERPESERLEVSQVDREGLPTGEGVGDRFDSQSAFSALNIPWRATLALSYSENKSNPNRPSRTAYIDLSNVEVQLTRNWRIGYRVRYDIERGDLADHRISFHRDLHCWEALFTWNPSGIGQGFYFRINIKASHLSQIKIEKRGGTSSVFSPF
ncbi:MAG: putative LPS assembly protein LptD [bacterium]